MSFKDRTKNCEQCSKPLVLRTERDVVRKRFCSRACNARWHSSRLPLSTRDAIALATRGVKNPRKGRSGVDNKRWSRTTRQCKLCSSDFEVRRCRDIDPKAGKYCSRACYRLGHSRGDQKYANTGRSSSITCQMCGLSLDVLPYRAKRQKFCSRKCAAVRAAQVMSTRRSDTWIERLVCGWLRVDGVPFEQQKPLLGITLVDFFVAPNLVIYTDGDYWHALPASRRKDAYQNKVLKESGYRVLRLSERSLAETPEPIRELLRNEVRYARRVEVPGAFIRNGPRLPEGEAEEGPSQGPADGQTDLA